MTIATSCDWESDPWIHNGDCPARTAWRKAPSEMAAKAKVTLPACNGRIDAAVKMALAGYGELLAASKVNVASQSNGQTAYHVIKSSCDCKDDPKAPSRWYKHRIAAGLHQRAYVLAKTKLDTLYGPSIGPIQLPAERSPGQPQGELVPALPEDPASANVHVTLAGCTAHVTLRDSDEQRLLAVASPT